MLKFSQSDLIKVIMKGHIIYHLSGNFGDDLIFTFSAISFTLHIFEFTEIISGIIFIFPILANFVTHQKTGYMVREKSD